MMSFGLAKRDNRIITSFLFTQTFDILLDCQLIRDISNNSNNYSKQLRSRDFDSPHYIINDTGAVITPLSSDLLNSFQILTKKLITFHPLM